MKGYRIRKSVIDDSFVGNVDISENTVDDEINILNYFKCKDKNGIPVLDGEQMIEDWFPRKKGKTVFISHSHDDISAAKRLSLYLRQEKGWDCFIDSEVWGSCYKLIKKIDDAYNRLSNEENLYTYNGCQKTTSDIYLMLTTAINKVINTCPIFIFIESENSVEDSTTYSPWIMEELNTYELLRPKDEFVRKNVFVNDSADSVIPNVEVSYKVDEILKRMVEIKNISDVDNLSL